jgi:hypothetical protein
MVGLFRIGEERRLLRLPFEDGMGGEEGGAGGEDFIVRERRGEDRSFGRVVLGGERIEEAASAAASVAASSAAAAASSLARGEGGVDC